MTRMKLYATLMICLLILSAFSGCKPGGPATMADSASLNGPLSTESAPTDPTSPPTSPESIAPEDTEPSQPDTTEPPPPESNPIVLYIPTLFQSEILPTELDKTTRESINSDVTSLLSQKQYSEDGKQLILSAVDLLCEHYSNFQTLFSLLETPDIECYIHTMILDPLEAQVDCICYPCPHSDLHTLHPVSSETMFNTRTLHVHQDANTASTAANLLSILCDIRAYRYQPDVDLRALGAYEQISRLTLIGSDAYHNLVDLDPFNYGDRYNMRYTDPEQPDHFLRYGKYIAYMSGDAVQPNEWMTCVYFKLYALTDYETMEQFLVPDTSFKVREAMVIRYGKEGGQLYDQLTTLFTTSTFDHALESEKLFLKLFLSRLEEVETPEDMISYLHLYRIYRKLFCASYMSEADPEQLPFTRTLLTELAHPELDYQTADLTVAKAIIRHHLLNTEQLTPELQLMMAYGLITPRKAIAPSSDRWDANYSNMEPYLMCSPKASISELADGEFYVEIISNDDIISNFCFTAEEMQKINS